MIFYAVFCEKVAGPVYGIQLNMEQPNHLVAIFFKNNFLAEKLRFLSTVKHKRAMNYLFPSCMAHLNL